MILHLHGQAFVGGVERRSLGDSPRLEHSFHLQAEIVVQARRAVFLYHEAMS